jgi:outer membrane protein assembly factor BamB
VAFIEVKRNLLADKVGLAKLAPWTPLLAGVMAVAALALWLFWGSGRVVSPRVPGTDAPRGTDPAALVNPVLAGMLAPTSSWPIARSSLVNPVLAGILAPADGRPADLPGAWPGFRGPNRTGISSEPTVLARAWEPAGPRQLWGLDLGEGYAGAAVLNGRVYVMDYDQQKRRDTLRCLSLADGKEIWRFAYPVVVKRNHGMSRAVPAVTPESVVTMGPKCHVACLDAASGQLKWGLDLVRQFGAVVPQWYAGQCPLIDGGKAILAVGGKDALLLAMDCERSNIVWRTPNPKGWKMTHSSVMPMDFAGQRMYVYCAKLGVVGVSAKDGALLWETGEWKISIATVPSPVILEEGRIFLAGGYDAGSLMLQLSEEGGKFTVHKLFKLEPEVFGAADHTPLYHNGHLYGVRPDGRFVCLDLHGRVVWVSEPDQQFGLGSFIAANGLIYALNDSGKLSLIEATPAKFNLLAQAQVLHGRESWGPLALAGGRLLARDLTRMVCLDVASR